MNMAINVFKFMTMNRIHFFALLVLIFGVTISCQLERNIEEISPSAASAPSHASWSLILRNNVSTNGNVNYPGIKADRNFEKYLASLEAAHPDESWSKNDRLAYWINAYNAYTVKLINDNWPVKSIKDIKSPWKTSFITIEGKTYSLEEIEHNILRKKYNEPRIHFAINCASFSCPKLLNQAFTAKGLEVQLEDVTNAFINDPLRNAISANEVKLSKIFDWFKGDFTKSGSLKDYINKFSLTKISDDQKISYMDYNWNLNN